jgi:hypothetical protein
VDPTPAQDLSPQIPNSASEDPSSPGRQPAPIVPEPILVVAPETPPEPVIVPDQPEPVAPAPTPVVVPGVVPEPVTTPDQVAPAPIVPAVPLDLVSGLPILPPGLEGLPASPGPPPAVMDDLGELWVNLPPGRPNSFLDDLVPTAPPVPDDIPIVFDLVPEMGPGQPDHAQPPDWHL